MAETENENPSLLKKIFNKSCDILDATIEIAASWQIGQKILKQTDNVLWTLEKSAEWSVPVPSTTTIKQPEANGTFGKPAPLVRPLPWIFFLPLLVIIRGIRVILNLGAVMIGVDSVKATTVVKFIQGRRRRLRALKFRGLRRMVQRKPSVPESEETATWRQRIYNTLKRAVCINYNHNDTSEKIVHTGNTSEDPVETHVEHKRKYKDMDSEEEEDRDYVPSESQSDDDSASDDCDDDEPVCNARPLLQRPSSKTSLTNEIIKEENEESDSTSASAESNEAQKKAEFTTDPDKISTKPEKIDVGNEKNNKLQENLINGITSDEFFSPEDSECPSPEPKIPIKCNITKNDLSESQYDAKISSQNIIASEQENSTCKRKKRKNKKKISNPFNRKRK